MHPIDTVENLADQVIKYGPAFPLKAVLDELDRNRAQGGGYGDGRSVFVIATVFVPASRLRGGAAAERAITAPFKSGDIIVREFASSKGTIEMAAETVINGRTLHLKDIAVYPRGAEAFELGTREVMTLRNQLAAQAREMGFDTLQITGKRLTGANPGKIVDVTIDLTK